MQKEYAVLKRSRLLFAIILMALATPQVTLAQTQDIQGQTPGTSTQADGQPEAGQSGGGATTTTDTTSRPVTGETATAATALLLLRSPGVLRLDGRAFRHLIGFVSHLRTPVRSHERHRPAP